MSILGKPDSSAESLTADPLHYQFASNPRITAFQQFYTLQIKYLGFG